MEITQGSQTLIKGETKYKEYPYRFVIILLFIISSFINTLLYSTLNEIAKDIVKLYDVSCFLVNLSSFIYMGLHPICSFFSNVVLDNYGIKYSIIFGLIMTISGAIARLFIDYGFIYFFLGQFFGAIGNPFITNSPAKISSTWFLPENRSISTTVLTISGSLSGLISIIFPSFVLDLTEPIQKSDVSFLIFVESCVVFAFSIPVFFFMQEKPEKPPSFTSTIKRDNFTKSFASIAKNFSFIMLMLGLGLIVGTFNSMVVVVSFLTTPYNFTSQDTTYIAISVFLGALMGCIICNQVLKHTLRFKLILLINAMTATVSVVGFMFMLMTENIFLLMISTFFLGFSICALLPISIEYGCEIAFPVGEGSAAGFLQASVHLFGLIFGIVSSFLTEGTTKNSTFHATILFATSFLVATLFISFTKEDLKRRRCEVDHRKESENGTQ